LKCERKEILGTRQKAEGDGRSRKIVEKVPWIGGGLRFSKNVTLGVRYGDFYNPDNECLKTTREARHKNVKNVLTSRRIMGWWEIQK